MEYEKIKDRVGYPFTKPYDKIMKDEDVLGALYFLLPRVSTIQCTNLLHMVIRKHKQARIEKPKNDS